jgi:hypothetical protein
MWLPAQSGKTRKCEESISEELNREEEIIRLVDLNSDESEDEKQQILNIIICSNNKALVNQTTKRMKTNVYDKISEPEEDINPFENVIVDEIDCDSENEIDSDERIVNNVFAWHSGLKNNKKTPDGLAFDILEELIKMVIVCANKTRLKYLYNMINRLENAKHFKGKINIWIDEADESFKLWNQLCFSQIIKFKKVNKITLISATFDNVVKKYGKIKVIPYAESYSKETYHRTSDSEIIEENYVVSKRNSCQYLEYIINKYESELCREGVRLFAPGNTDKRSHDEIATFLKSKGFVVVKINGTEKSITHPNGDKIDLKEYLNTENPVEIGKILSEIYISHGYFNYPYAITGLNCLGRGITFNDNNFIFTYGIIPPILNKSIAYQVCSRTNGNIKHLSNYLIPKLYMTTSTKNNIFEQENLAINISMYVHNKYQKNETYDGIVTNEDLKDINDVDGDRSKMHVPVRVFMTDEEFNNFIQIPERNIRRKEFIKNIIRDKNEELYDKLISGKHTLTECSIPEEQALPGEKPRSYDKKIINALRKINNNEKFSISVTNKNINSYQCFIDSKSIIKSIIVIIYDGKKNCKNKYDEDEDDKEI